MADVCVDAARMGWRFALLRLEPQVCIAMAGSFGLRARVVRLDEHQAQIS